MIRELNISKIVDMINTSKLYLKDLEEIRETEDLSEEQEIKYLNFRNLSELDLTIYLLCTIYKKKDIANKLGVSRMFLHYKMDEIQAKINGENNYIRCGKNIKIKKQ